MKKLLITSLAFALCTISAFAWGKDTLGPPEHKFAICLQLGQTNKLAGAEGFGEQDLFSPGHGDYKRVSIGVGAGFRYYLDESFFLSARFAYSTRRNELYDSTVNAPYDMINGNIHEYHTISFASFNKYRMTNVLIGLGGGHEGHYGHFVVRAGGEIDFIRYMELMTYDVSGNYDDMHQDTLSTGGSYNNLQLRGYIDQKELPLVWGIGITGHATLEYRLNPSFGIGATLYLGGFYTSAGNAKWTQTAGPNNFIIDSNGVNSAEQDLTTTELEYTTHQFDFTPLNAQINFAFYFGK